VDDYKNILVIRRDNIGDLVCTTPLLTALRTRFPGARIGVLANSYNAPVLAGNKDVDDVHPYRKLKHRADMNVISALAGRVSQLWALRCKRFDLVVVAGGAHDRRGKALAKIVSAGKIACSDLPVVGQHEVERTFTAARVLGVEGDIPLLSITPDRESVDHAREAIHHAGLVGVRPLVAMHISARRPLQRWPAEGFANLAIALHEKHQAATVLFWSPGASNHPEHPGDDEKAKRIVDLVAGKAPLIPWPTNELKDLIGGLAACDAVICSDGGAMHIAAALGKPIVCFFGDSQVDRWRPWGVSHTVVQSESHRVSDLTVAEVTSAACAMLSGYSPP
jgi:ADP-heptose:LPS heptosyltransferase